MQPYLHEYYSVEKFKVAYATPIPALTDQSHWPEVEIEFSMCPLLTKRKAGRPNQVDTRHGLRKVGAVRRGNKMISQKDLKKGDKNRCKLCEELGH
jgi:hypothetical protein